MHSEAEGRRYELSANSLIEVIRVEVTAVQRRQAKVCIMRPPQRGELDREFRVVRGMRRADLGREVARSCRSEQRNREV